MPNLKVDTLAYILDHDEVTAPDIAHHFGYKPRRISAVTGFIRSLAREDIMTTAEEKVAGRDGRMVRQYTLKKDIEALSKMWEKLSELQQPMHALLCGRAWVKNLIIADRLKIRDEHLLVQVYEMLSLSPTFFSLVLRHPSINLFIDSWFPWLRKAYFVAGDNGSSREMLDLNLSSPFIFQEFFAFCAFNDALNGDATEECITFLKSLVEENGVRVSESQAFIAAEAKMDTVRTVTASIRGKDIETLKWLMQTVDEYDEHRCMYDAGGRCDPKLRLELFHLSHQITERIG